MATQRIILQKMFASAQQQVFGGCISIRMALAAAGEEAFLIVSKV